MVEIVLYALVLGFTLSFMVGPVFFVLIETSLTKGAKKAIIFDAGVILADILFIGLTFFGSSYLKEIENYSYIYLVGGVLVVGYGVYNLINASRKKKQLNFDDEIPQKNAKWYVYLLKGFFLNFLNVGVLAWWLTTMLVVSGSVNHDPVLMLVYFAVTVVTYFMVDLVKIFFAHKLKKKLTPTVLVKIERAIGVLLIAFGVFLGLRGFFNDEIKNYSSDSFSISSEVSF